VTSLESESTYYRDHWLEVEPERVGAYEEMFRWRPQMEPLLAGAALAEGQVVVDYGCGPGQLTVELARRVGETGRVHGIELNDLFARRARERAQAEGVGERVSVHHIRKDEVPLPDESADRVICKNVLEYVDDPASTLSQFHAVLRPGGLAHAIDSDWGMLVVEPLGPERIAELFAAARHAYRTPLVGRRLYGLFRAAGFREVRVQVLASADTRGHMAPVVLNMAQYARASGRLPAARVEALVADLRAAIEAGTYLQVLPQFLVTGAR
jgi:ubiquinone/menaquinone biosynthesis C-methylase UbiE